ncbi:MAG TPA: zinc ribbon domain-containing protein [Vicinamibacterales bacterium]|jgi:putative FmdB family regulatory protein
MPLYEYECDACGHRFEKIQKFSDPLVDTCPVCGSHVHKLFSSPAIQFKGSGFYITDYPKGDSGTAPKSDGGKADRAAKAEKADTPKSEKSDKADGSVKSEKSASSSTDSSAGASSAPATSTSSPAAPAAPASGSSSKE